jgi:hypothetical protein
LFVYSVLFCSVLFGLFGFFPTVLFTTSGCI